MDYKLALQLKHAGFPQGIDLEDILPYAVAADYVRKNNGIHAKLVKQVENGIKDLAEIYGAKVIEYARTPTLSELIEACGESFDCLRLGGVDELEWQSWAFDRAARRNAYATGKTPEEAVARLWLALNKN